VWNIGWKFKSCKQHSPGWDTCIDYLNAMVLWLASLLLLHALVIHRDSCFW
jgi:hypothetical protein